MPDDDALGMPAYIIKHKEMVFRRTKFAGNSKVFTYNLINLIFFYILLTIQYKLLLRAVDKEL